MCVQGPGYMYSHDQHGQTGSYAHPARQARQHLAEVEEQHKCQLADVSSSVTEGQRQEQLLRELCQATTVQLEVEQAILAETKVIELPDAAVA